MTNTDEKTYLEMFKGQVKYAKPQEDDVDINIPTIRGNRRPKDWMKYLTKAGGFSWSMWRKPYVARVPIKAFRKWIDSLAKHRQADFEGGVISIPGKGMYGQVMFDGGHRREIHKFVFPTEKTMLCDVYYVDTVEEAHLQFVKIQFELQKRLHRDLLFIQSVLGNDENAKKVAADLTYTGLVVDHEGTVAPLEDVEDFTKPAISKNGFETICGAFDIDLIREGVDILKGAIMKGTQSRRFKFNQYLLYAVVDVLNELKSANATKIERADILSKSLDSWVEHWENEFGVGTQKEQLESIHTQFWKGASMSPLTAGIALNDLVDKHLETMRNVYPVLNIDPTVRQANFIKEAADRRQKRMNAKMAKGPNLKQVA